ncbi:uncharacterized protein LOC114543560 [Dendronephthya gigantea]|uniref:uncharacterized protein LOC114543560 n=1 Tax=Dendronephthya gigantea TaxID=151771 RepID=UPI0010698395|nr:uncharacterized protein LOC114543560 [Dendronephthya gigantea]
MSLFCPKGQFLVENDYKCADCPPGSYGTRINGVATCSNCPRGLYQSIPGQISCNKCPEGFVTADHGAIDQSQCEDENKFFLLFLLVNIYPGDVSVTANVSDKLEKFDLKPTRRALMTKKWKTKKTLILSAVDGNTNRTVKINGQSVIRLQPTPKNRVRSLIVLIIKG